jgi:hypothetical protein
VIDYAICSFDLYKNIANFEILDLDDKISDHRTIVFNVLLQNNIQGNSELVSNINQSNVRLKWNPRFQERFIERLDTLCSQYKPETGLQQLIRPPDVPRQISTAIEILVKCIKNAANPEMTCRNRTVKRNSKNVPWWNQTCLRLYDNYQRAVRRCRQTNNTANKENRLNEHRIFTRYFRKRKFEYSNQLTVRINGFKRSDPKQYWKAIKPRQQQNKTFVDHEEMIRHYKTLLQNPPNILNPADLEYEIDNYLTQENKINDLDAMITLEECGKAIKKLANNKAPGTDTITAEFIKAGFPVLGPYLVKIFNYIFENGYYPAEWTESILCSIYKSGDKTDPENYRGISLLNVLGKSLDLIFENRLRDWEAKHKKLSQSQAGFRTQYSTVDHIFTLQHIILRYRSEKKKVYVAFVDFCKAFDCINRIALLYKLIKEGLSPCFIRLVRSIYSKTTTSLKNIPNSKFPVKSGVQQGAVFSPLFFALFLNDFDAFLREEEGGHIMLNGVGIYSLLYADDMLIFSENSDGLQKSLDILSLYAETWGLKVNCNKSNIMIFRNPGAPLDNLEWTINNGRNRLTVVEKYKYLGIWFTQTGISKYALEQRTDVGNKAKFSLLSSLKDLDLDSITVFHLFDALVSSVLLYGAEVWGFLKTKDNVEIIHTSFMRHHLWVRKCVPLEALYGELGRIPLSYIATLRMIRYWFKLTQLNNIRYNKLAFLDAMSIYQSKPLYSPWCRHLHDTFRRLNMIHIWETQPTANSKLIYLNIKNSLFQAYKHDWSSALFQKRSLDNFIMYKFSHGTEEYLRHVKNKKHRQALIRFRLRSHDLEIEKGRYTNPITPREKRLCKYCDQNAIEDEVHFLICCSHYDDLRTPMISLISEYLNMNKFLKFYVLMSSTDPNTSCVLAQFVYLAFLRRSRQ